MALPRVDYTVYTVFVAWLDYLRGRGLRGEHQRNPERVLRALDLAQHGEYDGLGGSSPMGQYYGIVCRRHCVQETCVQVVFEVINPHNIGSLTIPRAGIKWV